MSREQPSDIIYISGKFLDRKEDIMQALQRYDLVQLRAKDTFIELAIQLSEYFVKKGWAAYEQFRSSLTTNQDGETVPQVLIKLNYKPEEETEKERGPERKEYRHREQDTREYSNKYEQRNDQRGRNSRQNNNYRK